MILLNNFITTQEGIQLKQLIMAGAVSMLVSACATGYGSSAFSYTGGYYEVKVNDKLTKVIFAGNGFLEQKQAEKYTLFRCAELAKQAGKPYFVMYKDLAAAAAGVSSTELSSGSIGSKPATSVLVRFTDIAEQNAKSTEEVLSELAAHRQASKNKKS